MTKDLDEQFVSSKS